RQRLSARNNSSLGISGRSPLRGHPRRLYSRDASHPPREDRCGAKHQTSCNVSAARLGCSSSNWVMNLPKQSAGFIFADAGFDVWMGNMRGNKYSKSHAFLDPMSSDFWNFTWDSMAQYDLPAMIDQVLLVSGQEHVYYIGHSQGTLTMFAKLSMDTAFSKKIKMFFALAPILTAAHVKGLLKTLIAEAPPELTSRIPVYFSHFPAGTSSLNMLHWVQMVRTGATARLDRGAETNIATYGQGSPPTYNFRDIPRIPIYLFSGGNDWIAVDEDTYGSSFTTIGPCYSQGSSAPSAFILYEKSSTLIFSQLHLAEDNPLRLRLRWCEHLLTSTSLIMISSRRASIKARRQVHSCPVDLTLKPLF
ncbi:hydrolase, alpha/beta domain protein, partial [Ostertagia ostertagi]